MIIGYEFGDPKRSPRFSYSGMNPRGTRMVCLFFHKKQRDCQRKSVFHNYHQTGTIRRQSGIGTSQRFALHVRDDVIAKFAALDLRRAFHLAREIVGHAFAGDRAV
ncbi:MAG: hypothetical protein QOF80_1917 [Verrucomicrobiota bacterium]